MDSNGNGTDVGNDQSLFVITIFEKIKETRLTFFWWKYNGILKDEHEEAKVSPIKTQLNKLNM